MSNAQHSPDWYERRHELMPGMIFVCQGAYVQLDRSVPGDATQWYVADWNGKGWSYYDSVIEPGDLEGEPLTEAAIAAAKGQ